VTKATTVFVVGKRKLVYLVVVGLGNIIIHSKFSMFSSTT
jgi:hypothetical protein